MKINKHRVIAFGIAALNMSYSCVYAEEKPVIISKDMNIHIPYAQYNSKNFWLDLKFSGRDASGNLIWKLDNYGVNSDQAISCQDAKEKNLLNKDGNRDDGVYTIKLNNSSLNVYCDMTTDDGGWTLVFRHDVNGGYFSGSGEASNTNQDNPSLSTQKYSILNKLNFLKKDSRFKFRLN